MFHVHIHNFHLLDLAEILFCPTHYQSHPVQHHIDLFVPKITLHNFDALTLLPFLNRSATLISQILDQIKRFNRLKEDFISNEDEDEDIKDAFTSIGETRFKEGLGCLHCGSVKLKRNGKSRGRQRYLCRD